MKGRLRVATIGAGFAQEVHLPVFRSRADCEIVAVCASSQEKAEQLADKLSIPRAWAYGNWRLPLEESRPDLVAIATPPSLQADIAVAALSRGIPVFCEKPLSIDLQQAKTVLDAFQRSNAPGVIDFEFPEIPSWRQCRELLGSGAVGNLLESHVNWHVRTFMNRGGHESWKTRTSEGGGALYSFGSHVLNYLEWFCGEISALSARISRHPDDCRHDGDTLNLIELRYSDGKIGSVRIDNDSRQLTQHRIEFIGTGGRLTLENTTRDYILGFTLNGPSGPITTPGFAGEIPGSDGRILAVGVLVNRFIEWIKTGVRAQPDLRSGYRVQQLIQAALESDRLQGAWISV